MGILVDTWDKPVEKPWTKPSEDVYGRRIGPTVGKGTEFMGILPDNPFGITRGPFPKDDRVGNSDANWSKAMVAIAYRPSLKMA
jgi:hypothetical protein